MSTSVGFDDEAISLSNGDCFAQNGDEYIGARSDIRMEFSDRYIVQHSAVEG
jgi:hypothetical protein